MMIKNKYIKLKTNILSMRVPCLLFYCLLIQSTHYIIKYFMKFNWNWIVSYVNIFDVVVKQIH